MAGVFDIDLENEDISDTEVCIQQTVLIMARPLLNYHFTFINNIFDSTRHCLAFFVLPDYSQDDDCDLTTAEPEK